MALPYDPTTAYFICGVFYEILPLMVWLVLAGQRNRALALWCVGGLLMGAAMMLQSMSGKLPQWQTTVLSQAVLMASHLARIQALRLDLGRPWRLRWMLIGSLVFLGVFEVLRSRAEWGPLRVAFATTVSMLMFSHLAWLAWRIGRSQGSRNAFMIALGYGLLAAMTVIYILDTLLSWVAILLIHHRPSQAGMLVAVMLSSVLGHFGYVGLALDRSVRQRIREAAEHARDEVSRRLGEQIAVLDRRRSLGELSASLGHELSQPLTAILTNAQVVQRALRTDALSTEQRLQLVDEVILNTQRASATIERIRDFIRPRPSRVEPVVLQQVVRDVLALVADEAHGKQVSFQLNLPAMPIRVEGDPIQLAQIVLNVFRNAIDALVERPLRQVQVSMAQRGERALLTVEDSGPGFSPEILSHAGESFLSAKDSKSTGLGLGLTISRSIAGHHHGSLLLRNVMAESGGGAVVELDLPAIHSLADDAPTP